MFRSIHAVAKGEISFFFTADFLTWCSSTVAMKAFICGSATNGRFIPVVPLSVQCSYPMDEPILSYLPVKYLPSISCERYWHILDENLELPQWLLYKTIPASSFPSASLFLSPRETITTQIGQVTSLLKIPHCLFVIHQTIVEPLQSKIQQSRSLKFIICKQTYCILDGDKGFEGKWIGSGLKS